MVNPFKYLQNKMEKIDHARVTYQNCALQFNEENNLQKSGYPEMYWLSSCNEDRHAWRSSIDIRSVFRTAQILPVIILLATLSSETSSHISFWRMALTYDFANQSCRIQPPRRLPKLVRHYCIAPLDLQRQAESRRTCRQGYEARSLQHFMAGRRDSFAQEWGMIAAGGMPTSCH
jgi:hypothetical protein